MWRSNTLTCKPTRFVSGCMSEFHFHLKATLMSRFHMGSWSRALQFTHSDLIFLFCITYLQLNVQEQRWLFTKVVNVSVHKPIIFKSHLVSAPCWSCDFNPCYWSLNWDNRCLHVVELEQKIQAKHQKMHLRWPFAYLAFVSDLPSN